MATTTFDNLITFSRGSNATVTGPNGLIQWAPNNLLTNSQDFEAGAWTKTNATITANSSVAPDGTTTADRLVNTALWGLDQSATLVAGLRYVISVWVRSGGTGKDTFILYGDGTQTSSTFTATSSWVRVEYSFVATVSGSRGNGVFRDSSNNPVDIFIWGAQLELGSTATAYNNTSVRNLLGFSEAFDNAAWTKVAASVVTGAQANPVNGLFNAQKLMESTATSLHSATENTTVVANTTYVASVYVKAAGRNWCAVEMGGSTFGFCFAYFNLLTGAVGVTNNAPIFANATSVGNGWWRISISKAATTSGSAYVAIYVASADGTGNYAGDGNSGVYIYGAMLSNSASLDPYVPTPGAAPSSTAYYGPRFDYDPVTLLPRGLLVEEARTNFIIYSDDLTNAAWTKSDATISSNSVVSPDGTSNADRATPSGATPIVRQTYTTSTVGAFTATVWLKSASATNATISLRPTGAGSPVSVVCAVTTAWQRFPVSITTSAGITALQFWVEGFSQAIDVWGAQLEAGAFATSYIPTVASTVTRSADVATITGSLFSQWYRQDEGAFVVDYDVVSTAAASKAFFATNDGTSNNTNYGYVFNTGVAFAEVRSGGATQAAFNLGPVTPNTTFKAALACKANDFAATSNGGAVSTDLSGAVALNQSELNIGHSRNYGGLYINGHIRNIRFIPARAADFQLQGLST